MDSSARTGQLEELGPYFLHLLSFFILMVDENLLFNMSGLVISMMKLTFFYAPGLK